MDGILLICKEKNYTSHDVVAIVKKGIKEKVGHTGTLDPMAEGVLPLLIGKGTKLSKYLINHDKEYKAILKLGVKTDTQDITGKIVQKEKVDMQILEEKTIKKVLESFLGKQEQKPPMYSAIKIQGKKLYEYARKGQMIEVPTRKIEIYDIKLVTINKEMQQITLQVSCSKGTYIRTLCEDIAQRLGTIGTMQALIRLQVGEFSINNTITIQDFRENLKNYNFFEEHLISFEEIFKTYAQIIMDEKDFKKFVNGVKLYYELPDGIYQIVINKKLVAIGEIKENKLKREIVF